MTHRELLDAACAGEPDALSRLLAEYRPRLYRYGLRVCASDADADDAVQLALTALPVVRRRDALSGWLFAVVRNTCRRLLRPTRTRERLEHLLRSVEVAVTPHDLLEQAEAVAAVQRALAALQPEHRELLVLRDLEGLSGEAAAARLDLTLEAMKSRLHRARLALKAALEAPDALH